MGIGDDGDNGKMKSKRLQYFLVWFRVSERFVPASLPFKARIWKIRVAGVWVGVCVCARARVCVCVCLCVCQIRVRYCFCCLGLMPMSNSGGPVVRSYSMLMPPKHF